MCAAYGAKDSGDARKALDLLLEAGDVGRESLQTDQVVEGNYTQHGQLVLYALTRLHERGETPVRTREVVEMYRTGRCVITWAS